jgi:hypothetical protein
MKNRLEVARDLLSEDGVIFVHFIGNGDLQVVNEECGKNKNKFLK